MKHSFLRLTLFTIFLTICVILPAQETSNSAGSQETQTIAAPAEDNSVSQIVPKAAALDEEFKKLPDRLGELVASTSFETDLNALRSSLNRHRSGLNELKSSNAYSFDKVSEIRGPARENLQALEKLQQKVTGNIRSIEQLRQNWSNHKNSWNNLKNLQANENESLSNIFKEAERKISEVGKKLENAEAPMVSLQKRASEIAAEFQKLIGESDSLIGQMRKELFRRSRPAMFTPTFFRQLEPSLWNEFWIGVASLNLPESSFYSSQGWIIVLQIFGIIFFVWLLGKFTMEQAEKIKLDFLLKRRFSAAVIAGVSVFYPLFEDLPNIFRIFLWSILTVAGARLVAGVIESPWRRRLIYLLAGLFLATQFCYLINLPLPIFRIYTAAVGLIGALICFWRARVNTMQNASLWFILAVKAGGFTMLLVFLTQVAGFVGLSNHLLEVAIKSVFFLLIVWIADLILRGLSEAAVDNKLVNRSQIMRKHSSQIINRMKIISDILAFFLAVSGILFVWGISDSLSDGASKLLSIGIKLQDEKLTLGIIATAIFYWYLAAFSSWLVQRILDEEVYPRKKVESGVGISINRLISYAFVLIGASVALSTIGIGLQSLAVLMGALGIGIGFGLQNIVNNFASGLILLFERSIKVGDVVQVNEKWGKIKNLGLRATVVQTFDKSELIVPNSDLVSSTVTNWTLSDRQIRVIIPIGVAYGSDVQLVTSILQRVALENEFVMKVPEPIVLFMNFGNSSLDFELRVFVSDLDNMGVVRNQINREIDRLFRENGVEIPFPQNDVHIRTMDESFKKSIKQLLAPTYQPEKDG